MSDNYFIMQEGQKQTGPHDLVSIVKKIRNGAVNADTMVKKNTDSDYKKAVEFSELAAFLTEHDAEESIPEIHKAKVVSLTQRLNHGWSFLQDNQLCTIFSGLFVLMVMFFIGMVGLFVPKALSIICYTLCFVVIQYFFTGYAYSVLRMVRGQPVDLSYVRGKMKPMRSGLFAAAFMMSFFLIVGLLFIMSGDNVASIIGLLIAALPGFYVMSLFAFTPLLMLDKGMDFWEALALSRRTVKKSGWENTGVLFSLLIINFLAGMAFLIPMIVSLPITISAVSDMYDELFS